MTIQTNKSHLLSISALASALFLVATPSHAGMVKDSHGNVGYDTYDECVAAVKNGTAKFYTPYTYQKPKRWKGETSVKRMKLSDVTIPSHVANNMSLKTTDYSAGACDLGVGKSKGRYGVSAKLVGKYVPFSADMPVNVYMNAKGMPVRVTMQQCDNHFGAKFPTPIISEVKAPAPQLNIDENTQIKQIQTKPLLINERRVYRPAKVKEVIVAPVDQIKQAQTANGTAVAVQTPTGTHVVGQQVDKRVLNDVAPSNNVPVTQVGDVDKIQEVKRVYDPKTGQYVIVQ